MIWRNVNDLPLNECCIKKLVVLTHGRLDNNGIYLCTGTWLVQKVESHSDWLKKDETVISNDKGYYGKLKLSDICLPLNKIIAWTYASELIDDYNGRREKEKNN